MFNQTRGKGKAVPTLEAHTIQVLSHCLKEMDSPYCVRVLFRRHFLQASLW